jgi:branched-chain amino acid transport system substrate-binding protein
MDLKLWRVAAVPLAVAVGLAGCATQNAAGGGGSNNAAGDCSKGNAQGVTDSTIKLGAFTPLSGPVSPVGEAAVEGQKVYFDKVNAGGGVQGRKIEFITQDDKYDPAAALAAVRRLNTSEKVFALSGGAGTPNFVATLPYLKSNHVPAIGPYAPSNQVGVIENPDVYMIWPNFVDEFKVSVKWMVENKKPKKIAMLQMTGDVGDDAMAGTKAALEGSGLKLEKVVNVEATTTDYSAAVLALKNTGADWVISINQPTGTGQVIQAAKKIGYNPKWVTQSDMTDAGWLDAFGKDAEGLVAATKAAPLDSDDPMVKDFVTTFTQATGKAPSLWNSVGYAQAQVTVEALQKAKALTRECLEESLQSMSGYETGLIPPVTFTKDERQGTKAVGVAEIVDGKVKQAAPFTPLG